MEEHERSRVEPWKLVLGGAAGGLVVGACVGYVVRELQANAEVRGSGALLDAPKGGEKLAAEPAFVGVGASELLPGWTMEGRVDLRGKRLKPLRDARPSWPVKAASGAVLPADGSAVQDGPFASQPSKMLAKTVRFQGSSRHTVDELLATCPTSDELAQIDRDFPAIYVDETVTLGLCSDGSDENSDTLLVYNCFRVLRDLEFDAPLPLFETTNLYRWMRDQNLTFRFARNVGSEGRDRVLTMGLPPPLLVPSYRAWRGEGGIGGIGSMVALMVHELRHATSGLGHNCRPNDDPSAVIDESLAYGGAWAAQYWWNRWLAEHAGAALSDAQKSVATADARSILANCFCDQRGGGQRV